MGGHSESLHAGTLVWKLVREAGGNMTVRSLYQYGALVAALPIAGCSGSAGRAGPAVPAEPAAHALGSAHPAAATRDLFIADLESNLLLYSASVQEQNPRLLGESRTCLSMKIQEATAAVGPW
jgi:hypothetical protein